jgi:hypothetical protein
MPQAVPAIYARVPISARLGWVGRVSAGGIALACFAVFFIAASIRPDPRGVGTHQQLGLQACQFEDRTGLPCPTCGMTTSFTLFVRGQLARSFYVQPMGMVLAGLCAMMFWAAAYIAATGGAAHRLFRFLPTSRLLFAFFALVLLAWGWKILIHVTGRDGWAGNG